MSAVAEATRPARLQPHALTVVWALARLEARRLARHPLTILGALLGAPVPALLTWWSVPVLNRDDSLTAEALLPMAAGVLVAAHLATLRPKRHHATELHTTMPTSDRLVTAGHLVSVVLIAGLAFLLAAAHLAYLWTLGGVGTPRPFVVLTGPAVVVLAGVLGVALGRWAPWLPAGPIALVGVVAGFLVVMNSGSLGTRRLQNLSPVMVGETWTDAVSEFSFRPAGWHLAYVAGLAAIAACGALLHHHPRTATAALTSMALAFTFVAGYAQMRPATRAELAAAADLLLNPEAHRSCVTEGGVRYCSYDDYLPWIERWREVVAPVVAAAPARPAGLAITQLPGTEEVLASMQLYGGTRYGLVRRYDRMRARAPFRGSGAIHPRLQWGRHEKEGEFGLGLALAVAGRATGIRTHFRLAEADLAKLPRRARRPGVVGRLGRRVTECATLEQGRAVVALWLAAQATPATEAAYRRAARGLPYQVPGPDVHTFYPPVNYVLDEYDYDALGWPGFGAQWGTREAAYATQLLERDDAAVRAELRAHWERLTDPRTTTDEAARMLGLERVPSLERVVEASDMSLARDVFYLPFCR